jgi:ADP-heptose:LPS heptosyltransferase
MKPVDIDGAARSLQSRHAGSYTTEVVHGPRGPLVIYRFGFDDRQGRRLLVLKLDHYGDFLIGLPALNALRQAFESDHITLVCGSWNVEFVRGLGIADEVRAYDFFPENGALWSGQPWESLQHFREVCHGSFDIALDLRVDEDTRFLLQHIEANIRCGIGVRARHPFLDVALPPEFERRESDGRWVFLAPDQFESRMPHRTPFFHENDFSVTDTHLVFGPYVTLPQGRFRAHFGLRLISANPRDPGVETSIDVTRDGGSEIIKVAQVLWTDRGDPRGAEIEFTSDDSTTGYEFRVHTGGRPIYGRLRFFGVRLEQIEGSNARFKPAELHIGEQLSLLVTVIEQRLRKLANNQFSGTQRSFALARIPGAATAEKLIVISPLSNSDVRDWGIENYTRLVELLLEKTAGCVVLVGSKAQRDLLDRIVEQTGRDRRITNIAGASDWLETAELIRAADLVIANNSGVAHLAAACGTPTIAIYSGSHQPQQWGPRGNDVDVIMALVACSPCGFDRLKQCPHDHQCMKRIAPETVVDHAVMMLSGRRCSTTHAPRASTSPHMT